MKSRPAGTKTPGKNDFDTTESAVQQWVDDLPIINTEKTRALLLDALENINSLEIEPAERYRATELLSTPVLFVTNALKKEFLGKNIPLTDKYLFRAQHCLDLYYRMATSYEIMAADLGRMSGRKPRLATSLHRAMRYLAETLLTNYQIYVHYPVGIWKSIHTLYATAEKEKRTARVVTDKTLASPHGSTIETVYKQIMLLSLACPYRLRQKEICFVQQSLFEWSAVSSLSRAAEEHAGLFAVNLLSDAPPSYRELEKAEEQPDQAFVRILDTSRMADLLRKEAARASREHAPHNGVVPGELLKRLMLAWGVMPKRRFTRHLTVTDVELIVGIDAIHNLLKPQEPDTVHTPAGTEGILLEEPGLEDPTLEVATHIRAHPITGTSRDMSPGNHDVQESESDTRHYRAEAWKISDMSAGGYCLLAESGEPTSARVGELIAIRTRDEHGRQEWQLGVSRRIRFSRDRGLELGLQMLSPGARPVWTGICRDGTTPTTRMKGILLPELKAINQASSLLLPSLPFHVGSTSVLEDDGRRNTITLTQQLENTGIFGHYHYSGMDNL